MATCATKGQERSSDSGRCIACPEGTYKSTDVDGPCLPCAGPKNIYEELKCACTPTQNSLYVCKADYPSLLCTSRVNADLIQQCSQGATLTQGVAEVSTYVGGLFTTRPTSSDPARMTSSTLVSLAVNVPPDMDIGHHANGNSDSSSIDELNALWILPFLMLVLGIGIPAIILYRKRMRNKQAGEAAITDGSRGNYDEESTAFLPPNAPVINNNVTNNHLTTINLFQNGPCNVVNMPAGLQAEVVLQLGESSVDNGSHAAPSSSGNSSASPELFGGSSQQSLSIPERNHSDGLDLRSSTEHNHSDGLGLRSSPNFLASDEGALVRQCLDSTILEPVTFSDSLTTGVGPVSVECSHQSCPLQLSQEVVDQSLGSVRSR